MGETNEFIKVTNLTKSFGELLVLDGVSFNINKGDFMCVVGPTGCGKTTFLNTLTKLYEPTSGEILVSGQPVDLKKNNIAYIFQELSTLPWRTVEKNVEYGLELRHIHKANRKAAVNEALELVGLTEYRDYYPDELSSSMLQRVVIARAFASKPELLLMDEPYGQLDLELRYKLEDELIRIWQRTETTILFITHNIEEAVYMSQKILVLTNKPTKIKELFQNDLPRPRCLTDPEFVKVRNRITELIKWW